MKIVRESKSESGRIPPHMKIRVQIQEFQNTPILNLGQNTPPPPQKWELSESKSESDRIPPPHKFGQNFGFQTSE